VAGLNCEYWWHRFDQQGVRDCETLNKANGGADAHRGNDVGKLKKLVCRVDWEGVIARRDGNLIIGFKEVDNGCNVNFFLLYRHQLVY